MEVHRRQGEGADRQPRDREVRGRHDRQRGGLHRRARHRGRGRRREPDDASGRRIQEDDREGGVDLPELQGGRDDAALGEVGDGERLERALLVQGRAAPVDPASGAGDLRPRRRRRLVRVGADLRTHDVRRRGKGGQLRRGARGARDDDARRHLDGDEGRRRKARRRRLRPRR